MESVETTPAHAGAGRNRPVPDDDRGASPVNRATAQRLMRAMREQDFEAIAEVLATDVVIDSPITSSFQFRGREDAVALLKIVRAGMEHLEHDELLGADDVWAQRFRVRVRGRLLDGIDMLRFDEAGRVCSMTVFVRPLPGLVALAATVVPAVGRRRGRLASIALRLLLGPLAGMTRHGDRLAARLLRGSWGITG